MRCHSKNDENAMRLFREGDKHAMPLPCETCAVKMRSHILSDARKIRHSLAWQNAMLCHAIALSRLAKSVLYYPNLSYVCINSMQWC